MSRGTHGPDCGAVTWRTSCPRCQDRVFFFRCDHGSKVFFDELGQPWPIHDCDGSWGRGLRRIVGPNGTVQVEVAERVTVIREPRRFAVDARVVSLPTPADRSDDHPIVRQDPPPRATADVVGVLREIKRSVDPLASLRLDDTSFGLAALGPVGTQPVGRFTLHAPTPYEDETESYTAFAPRQFLDDPVAVRGATVEARLVAVEVLGRGVHWFCTELEVLA